MEIILYQPQIPQNTGNIVRTCSVTGTKLTLVTPLGFSIKDRLLKRAGLDYWEGVDISLVDNLMTYLEQNEQPFLLFSSKGTIRYTEIVYASNQRLVFGSETQGLPPEILQKWPENVVTIPMNPGARCLNLATSVGIGLYEGLRQILPLPDKEEG